jgi:HD superfamily phosphohydrolase
LSARAENQGEWWDRQRLLFTIACLLHDCAHAPFSHTLEYVYQHISHEKIANGNKLNQKEQALVDYLNSCGAEHEFGGQLEYLSELDWQVVNEFAVGGNDFMADYFSLKKKEGESPKLQTCGKEHEKLSALMLRKEPSMKEGIEIIYSDRFPGLPITAADTEFMARAILGCLYSQKHESEALGDVIDKELRNCLIKLLNSDLGFDVDGFDYTVRDTKNSGYYNYSVDYQRILSSFTLVKVDGAYQLGVKHGCIGALRQYIDARNSLYRDIYAHHKVTFMSSVLRPELLKLSAKWLCCKAFMFPEVTDDTERKQRTCECLAGSLGTECKYQQDIYYSDFITAKLLGFDDFCGATDKHFSCGYHIHHSTDTDLDFIFKQIYKESAGYESTGAKIVNRYLKSLF